MFRLHELAAEKLRNGDYIGVDRTSRYFQLLPGRQAWVGAAIAEILHREAEQMIRAEDSDPTREAEE